MYFETYDFSRHAAPLSACDLSRAVERSDEVRPQAQDGEGPAVFAQQQADLVVVRVGVQGLVVLLVLHLVLRGVSALSALTGLRGARLRGALLPPLGATVLKPHLEKRGKIHVVDWSSNIC